MDEHYRKIHDHESYVTFRRTKVQGYNEHCQVCGFYFPTEEEYYDHFGFCQDYALAGTTSGGNKRRPKRSVQTKVNFAENSDSDPEPKRPKSITYWIFLTCWIILKFWPIRRFVGSLHPSLKYRTDSAICGSLYPLFKFRPNQRSVDTCILLLKIGPIWRFLDPYIPLFKNFDRLGGSLGVCNPFEKLGPIQWYMKLCITISNSDRFSGPWIPATLFETCTDSTVRGSLSLIKRVFGRSSYDYPWIFLPSMDGLWIFSLNFITFWLPICSYWGQNGRTDKVKLWPL